MKVSEGAISHLGYINLPVNLYKEWASTPLPAWFKLFSCHTSTSWPSGQLNLLTEDQSIQKEMGSWLLRMGNWEGWPPFPPTPYLGSTGNDPGVYWCGAWCCLFFSIRSFCIWPHNRKLFYFACFNWVGKSWGVTNKGGGRNLSL